MVLPTAYIPKAISYINFHMLFKFKLLALTLLSIGCGNVSMEPVKPETRTVSLFMVQDFNPGMGQCDLIMEGSGNEFRFPNMDMWESRELGSIKIPDGCTVTIYNDTNFKLKKYRDSVNGQEKYKIDKVFEFNKSMPNFGLVYNMQEHGSRRPRDVYFGVKSIKVNFTPRESASRRRNPVVIRAIEQLLDKPFENVTNDDLARIQKLDISEHFEEMRDARGNLTDGSKLAGAFDGMTSLEELTLSSIQSESVDSTSFSGLKSLKKLDLSTNNIKYISKSAFLDLENLEELDLAYNILKVDSLDSLSHCKKLRTLNLSNNVLEMLPPNFLSNFENLEELNLADNQLTVNSLDSLSHCKKLRTLNLSNNVLEMLPPNFLSSQDSLKDIDLSQNNIVEIPSKIFYSHKSLTEIDISSNSIKLIPEKLFSRMPSLKYLSLSHNEIRTLPSNTFQESTSIVLINISNNDLNSLPEDLFTGLNALEKFRYSDNPDLRLPTKIFEGTKVK
jgi:Leucine-rich repeat (LRR) protein